MMFRDHEAACAIEDCASWRRGSTSGTASGWGDSDHQRRTNRECLAVAVIQSALACAIVRNPERASGTICYTPGVDQVRIRKAGDTRDVRNQVGPLVEPPTSCRCPMRTKCEERQH